MGAQLATITRVAAAEIQQRVQFDRRYSAANLLRWKTIDRNQYSSFPARK